ncbi:DegV family protein [Desulfobacterales bacterium HSG16]|nr:DegV family protein [Desulfobacterales bacterium HSG16]
MTLRVFIVENDQIMGNLLEVRLSDAGYDASFFDNAEKALDILKQDIADQRKVRLMICDVVNGLNLHELLRKNIETSDIPFIFTAQSDEISKQVFSLCAGMDDHIEKPFKVEDLLLLMENVIADVENALTFKDKTDFSGRLEQIGMSDLFKIMEIGHKSGELVIKNPGEKYHSRLFFKDGRLTNSQTGDPADNKTAQLTGEDAFFEIMTKSEGDFSFFKKEINMLPQITAENWDIFYRGLESIKKNENPVDEAERILLDTPLIPEGLIKVLASFTQRKATGILEIRDLPKKAAVYFQNGSIVHVVYGKAEGKKALFRIFGHHAGIPEFHSRSETIKQTISGNLKQLLQEGNRSCEIIDGILPEEFEQQLDVLESALGNRPDITAHKGLSHVISLTRQYQTVTDILDAGKMSDYQIYKNLGWLIKAGVLRPAKKGCADICLITDSTSDLTEELIRDLNIFTIPISVNFEDNIWIDGVDMSPSDFYKTLKSSKIFPSTIPPSVESFHDLFARQAGQNDIIALFLSGDLSSTVENAIAARDNHYGTYQINRKSNLGEKYPLRIQIIDSRQVSLGMGILIVSLAEKIREGLDMDALVEFANACIPKIRVFFIADTLEYLHRGGRIGKTGAFVGKLLNSRPIMGIHEGKMKILDKGMGWESTSEKLIDWLQWSLDDPTAPVRAGVMHADAPDRAEMMAELIKKNFDCHDLIISQVGPTLGTHCGPGSVGVACMPLLEGF